MGRVFPWHSLLLLIALGALVLASCRPVTTPTPTPTPINVTQLLLQSAQRMAALSSFALGLRHQKGGTPLDGALLLETLRVEVERPDRLRASYEGALGGTLYMRSEVIVVGKVTYMVNPFSGAWETVDLALNPLSFFDPATGIGGMLAQVQQASFRSQERVEGADTYHLSGLLAPAALEALFGTVVTQGQIEVDLWLDQKALYLVKAVLRGRITPTEAEGVVREIALSQFDQAFGIQAPQVP